MMNRKIWDPKHSNLSDDFSAALGKIVANFSNLEDNLNMASFTMTKTPGFTDDETGITKLSGGMSQEAYRIFLSKNSTNNHIENYSSLAQYYFPDHKKVIKAFAKELIKTNERRNQYVHSLWAGDGHNWYWNPAGKCIARQIPLEELDAFKDEIARVNGKLSVFTEHYLLGIYDDHPEIASNILATLDSPHDDIIKM